MKPILTTHEAAQLLGVHPFTVGRHLDQGLLKGFRTAGGHRRIETSEVVRYMRDHGIPVPADLGGAAFKLLVVDDEQQSLNAIRRAFKPHAAAVSLTMTTSGMEALLMASDLRPDGLLVDINMPGLDGFELCRRMLKYPTLKHLKVVAMTAVLKTDVLGSALTAGARACLEKPISPKEVLQHLAPEPVKRATRARRAG